MKMPTRHDSLDVKSETRSEARREDRDETTMCVEMSQKSELTTGAGGSDARSATNRQRRLHQFRRPVDQQSAEFVERCPLTTWSADAATAAGVTRRHDAKQPRGDWLGQPRYTTRKEGATEHETSDNVHNVGLKPCETKPHHVSGARTVAAPVPRPGEQAHGLQNNSVSSTSSKWREEKLCGKSTSDPTQSVETREAQRRQHVATSAWKRKEEHTQPQEGGRASSLQPDADAKRSGTPNLPRAETAPVAMQLSDARQSRDECLHGRTQLWASATRELIQKRTHVSPDVTTRHMTSSTPSTVTPKKGSSGRSKITECTLTVQRKQVDPLQEEAREASECGE